MLFVKSRTLYNIASGGAIIAMSLSVYAIKRQENLYKDSKFFKEAMTIMENHEGVKKYLGTNLSARAVQPQASEEPSPLAEFTAKVSGSKSSGQMYFWAERIVDGDNIRIEVKRIELEMSNDKSKRLLVKS